MHAHVRWSCLSLLLLPVIACSSTGAPADDSETIGETAQAVTSKGKAVEGDNCLLAPKYRKDKCTPGLTCATLGGASNGVCVGPHAEAEDCNPAYGNAGCAGGLACTGRASGSGGFCKGAGTGACRVANGGADCATGRSCIESSAGSGKGTCSTDGTEGSACNDNLVQNECTAGFECVVPNGRPGNDGICTNATAGGIGALCGKSNPTQPNCALSSYVCAPDPAGATVPGSWGQSYANATWRCRVPGKFKETCAGADTWTGGLGGATGCESSLGCYSDFMGGDTSLLKAGRCDTPATHVGDACGAVGVNNCTWEGDLRNGGYMACVSGHCMHLARYGESCVTGGCAWAGSRQMTCDPTTHKCQ